MSLKNDLVAHTGWNTCLMPNVLEMTFRIDEKEKERCDTGPSVFHTQRPWLAHDVMWNLPAAAHDPPAHTHLVLHSLHTLLHTHSTDQMVHLAEVSLWGGSSTLAGDSWRWPNDQNTGKCTTVVVSWDSVMTVARGEVITGHRQDLFLEKKMRQIFHMCFISVAEEWKLVPGSP